MSESSGRMITRQRADRHCEGCGRVAMLEHAHRKARSQGGGWEPSCGLRLCRTCHAFSHAHPDWSYANGWMVKRDGDPRTTPVRVVMWGLLPAWVDLDDEGQYALLHAVGPDAPLKEVDGWSL